MKLVHDIYEANCITHSGTMHADDIFATAFLDLYLKNILVYRATNIPTDISKKTIIYDIGRGDFDHHQENAQKRDNGITYCSFGLLWKEFGKDFLIKRNITNADDVYLAFDKDFIEAIDADDNGIFPKIEAEYKVKTLSEIFKLFNPSYKSGQKESEQFIKAVSFAKAVIEEELLNVIGKVAAKEQVLKAIEKKENHAIFLEEYMPYEQTVLQEESAADVYFAVYPSNRGGYGIKTIPISSDDHTKRKDFPAHWAGLVDEELEKSSGIKGLKFCHTTRFLATCDSLETAKLAIETTLKESSECLSTEKQLDKIV